MSALYWNYQNRESHIDFNDLSKKTGASTREHKSHTTGIDFDIQIKWGGEDPTYNLTNILPGKKGYNLYIKSNNRYQNFGKEKIQEYTNLVNELYPNSVGPIYWCDWTVKGVSSYMKRNLEQRFKHRHHIHLRLFAN